MATSGVLEFVAKIDDQASAAIGTLERTFDSIGGPIDPILGEVDVDADDALTNLDAADDAIETVDGSEALAEVDADIAAAESALDDAETAVGDVDGTTATAEVDADTTAATDALEAVPPEAETVAEDAGSRFHEGFLKAAAIAALAATVVAGFQQLYEVGAIFDDVTDGIRVGTGAQGEALEELTGVVDELGKRVPRDFQTIGTTVADLNTRLGLSGDTLEAVAEQYLWAGQILGEDVDINATSAAFNAFQIEGEGVVDAMDHLFRVSQATGVGMSELASAATQSAPAMDMLGFSFEETTALAGQLDKQGLNSSQMLSGLSRSLVNLAKDGEEPAEAFERTIDEMEGFIASGDRAAAIDLAGKVFGTRGASQFVGALESGSIALDDIVGSAGMTEDTIVGLGEETADFAESWQLVKNGAQQALEPLGSAVFDTLGGALESVMPYLESFGQWAAEHPDDVQAVAVALGVLAAGLGVAAAAQWVMNSALLASPITWLIIGIAALVAAIVILIMHWDEVVAWMQGVWATVSEWFKGTWDSISAKVSEVWAAIVAWVQGAIESVRETITNVLTGIASWWSETWEAIKTTASGVWDAIVTWVTDKINAIRDTIALVLAAISAAWTAAWNGVRDAAKAVWDAIKLATTTAINAVSSVVSSVMGRVLSGWRNIWDSVKAAAAAVWDAIKAVVRGAIDNVKATIDRVRDVIATVRNAFNDAKEAARDKMNALLDLVRDLPNRILRGLGNLGNLLINAGRDVIQGFIDGITGGFRRVRDKLSELTDLLPDWKGPEDTDKTILVDPGRYVIDGFIAGLEDRYGDAEASLRRFTDGLSAAVDLGPDMTAAGLPGGRTTYTVTTRLDEGDRQLMREFLRYAAKVAERPIETTVKMDRRKLATAVTAAQAWEGER